MTHCGLTFSFVSVNRLSRSNDALWTDVHNVVSSYTASDVLSSLRIYTDSTTANLHNKTAAVDIFKDAEQLRYTLTPHSVRSALKPSINAVCDIIVMFMNLQLDPNVIE
jgi:HAUS augmin-like complex subunit 5